MDCNFKRKFIIIQAVEFVVHINTFKYYGSIAIGQNSGAYGRMLDKLMLTEPLQFKLIFGKINFNNLLVHMFYGFWYCFLLHSLSTNSVCNCIHSNHIVCLHFKIFKQNFEHQYQCTSKENHQICLIFYVKYFK